MCVVGPSERPTSPSASAELPNLDCAVGGADRRAVLPGDPATPEADSVFELASSLPHASLGIVSDAWREVTGAGFFFSFFSGKNKKPLPPYKKPLPTYKKQLQKATLPKKPLPPSYNIYIYIYIYIYTYIHTYIYIYMYI
jgi:hypothetical protein